jgi:hypothetical protein
MGARQSGKYCSVPSKCLITERPPHLAVAQEGISRKAFNFLQRVMHYYPHLLEFKEAALNM